MQWGSGRDVYESPSYRDCIIRANQLTCSVYILKPEVRITPEGGDTETAALIKFVGPFAGIPSLTKQALHAHIGTTFDEFFKQLRETSNYRREWEFLQLLPDKSSREWAILALSLCAQFAVQTSVFHPYLAEDARKSLKANSSTKVSRIVSTVGGRFIAIHRQMN